jgi:hypothetical protein
MMLLASAFLAVGVAGCGGDNEAESGTTESDNYGFPEDIPRENTEGELLPPPVQIGGGTDSGKRVSKDTVFVIRSEKELEKLARELSKGRKDEIVFPSPDFETRQVIAVILKPKKDGAQAQVDYVRKGSEEFVVHTVRLPAGSGCSGDGRKSYPYSVVETEKLSGEAKLVVENQESRPC